mmetsp:Transcript_4804/g.9408  ORF Transcript_4804/g.9408 Transcript_4804/m.9408 type:complete len:90 (+) Transcript_4804:255-524(+)
MCSPISMSVKWSSMEKGFDNLAADPRDWNETAAVTLFEHLHGAQDNKHLRQDSSAVSRTCVPPNFVYAGHGNSKGHQQERVVAPQPFHH